MNIQHCLEREGQRNSKKERNEKGKKKKIVMHGEREREREIDVRYIWNCRVRVIYYECE